MKRKLILKLMAVTLLVFLPAGAYAASSADVDVQAVVPELLDLSVTVREVPASATGPYDAGTTEVTLMDFGTLELDPVNNIFVADKYFTVFLAASTSGRAYRIEQTNNGVVSGGDNLNDNIIMTPDYQSGDEIDGSAQGAIPSGDSFGSAQLSVGSSKLIYNGSSGQTRIARAYYGIATGDAGEPSAASPVTLNQQAGTYSGTVTFTVVLQ